MDRIFPTAASDLTADDLLEAYAWPGAGRWVRAMMVTTLDGAAAGPDGLSGSISSGVDREVFGAVRRLADAVLVGAGTLRAEEYGPVVVGDADVARRAAAGQAPAAQLVVVSGSLHLPWALDVWRRSGVTPLVLTGPEPDPARLAAARVHVEVLVLADTAPATLLAALEDRGLRRIVCEGGPTLLEAIVAAGLLDEACITLSPAFAGTAAVPRTAGLAEIATFTLVQLLHAESFLMGRYVRPERP